MIISVILAIPNITWPIGSTWYESIQWGFGIVSLFFILINGMAFFSILAYGEIAHLF